MPVVADVRQALQHVIAPDLKAAVAGLSSLQDEMRRGNALQRGEMAAAEERGIERLEKTETRLVGRVNRIFGARKLDALTRRNAELKTAMEQLRKTQQPAEQQQH